MLSSSHPGFGFRMWPLDLSIRIQCTTVLLHSYVHKAREISHTLLSNESRVPDGKGAFLLLDRKTFTIPQSYHQLFQEGFERFCLPAPFHYQQHKGEYFRRYNASPPELFKWFSHTKLRPNILSFAWRLLHHPLFLYLITYCPLLWYSITEQASIFSTTAKEYSSFNSQPPLTNLTYYNHHTLTPLISCWAIWKSTWGNCTPWPKDQMTSLASQ